MTPKIKFDEFVAQQASRLPQAEINWNRNLEDWLDHISHFFKLTSEFLDAYLASGQIQIDYGTKRIIEEYIGEYEAKTATITIGKSKILLDPIGTNLIGAKGRIDMIGPNGKVKFVLVDADASAPRISVRVWVQGEEPPSEIEKPKVVQWTWKIGTPPPNIKYIELNRESFFDSLMEVANG
ncbi:hypothetical protein [Rhodocyclus purpureus]|uniref:hypothetical protein n=1 Tax=Rhodocyclus purpureus TaxID=1067 RepID=UPI001914CC79|nr:hypothetical protein [Rhodocyclus purpureus]